MCAMVSVCSSSLLICPSTAPSLDFPCPSLDCSSTGPSPLRTSWLWPGVAAVPQGCPHSSLGQPQSHGGTAERQLSGCPPPPSLGPIYQTVSTFFFSHGALVFSDFAKMNQWKRSVYIRETPRANCASTASLKIKAYKKH